MAKNNNSFYQRFIISIALLQVLHMASMAQQNYRYSSFTQEEGLASSTLNAIGQDSTGFLWLLSENGLSRFDGYSFKVFRHDAHNPASISSSITNSMSIDEKKRIFFKTENSISEYIPSDNSFKTVVTIEDEYFVKNYFIRPEGCWLLQASGLVFYDNSTNNKKMFSYPTGFRLNIISALLLANGNIWCSNGEKIICFNIAKKMFTSIPVNYIYPGIKDMKSYVSLFFSNENGELCYFSNNGLFKFNSQLQSFTQYSKNNIAFSPGHKIVKVIPISNKKLAVEMLTDKIYVVDISTGQTTPVPLSDPSFHVDNPIETSYMIRSYNGTLWVSTSNAGLFRIDPEKAAVIEHHYNKGGITNSLESDNIGILLEDHHVLWMTSPGIGLLKAEYNGPLLPAFRPTNENNSIKSTPNANVRAINELNKENLLIGTVEGLFNFNKLTHVFSPVLSPADNKPLLQKSGVSAIVTDPDKNIWIAGWNWGSLSVYVLNYDKKKCLSISLDKASTTGRSTIRSMYLDSRNNLWFGTDKNIIYRINTGSVDLNDTSSFQFEKFKGQVTTTDTLIFDLTFAFAENTNGQILIGAKNGMFMYNYATGKFKKNIYSSLNHNALRIDDVRCFYSENKDNFWIGTHGGGLIRTNQNLTTYTSYTRENGLPDNYIYTVLGDQKKNLWLGTNRGISCFNPVNNYIRNYSLNDGLQNYEFNTNAAYKTSSGELVFGGINGFNIFYPDSIRVTTAIPEVVISEFKVNDKDFPVSDPITLTYDQNSVSFQFAALSYFRGSENLYAYKLDGVNQNWVYCDIRRFSNYAGLAPGEYTFHVKACNYSGFWNEKGISLRFKIEPPYWKTWWFKFLMLLIVSGIIYLFFRYRLKQKLQVELLRNKIARDLHDEIGSNLSSISLFSAAAKERYSKESGRVSPLLQKISEYTQASQESINDIVWMINAKNDAFGNIIIRMRRRAAEIFEATSIHLHMNLDESLNTVKIDMDGRQNFYLIYKEALNNVIKYAHCKNIWIDLHLKGNTIFLIIRDDGIGFDMVNLSHSNGLGNMHKRAEFLNGKLVIKSQPGSGTIVTFSFPAS